MKNILLLFSLIFVLVSCGSDFIKSKNWVQMGFIYWVLIDGKRVDRNFTINDKATIEKFRSLIEVKEIRSKWNAMGAGKNEIIDLDGNIWIYAFVFEDRLDICKKLDPKHSYSYELKNDKSYKYYRELCLENEIKINKDAIIENIIVRSNLSDECYIPLKTRPTR